MQTADPLRTPTYTLFPKPDYFFSTIGTERQHQHAASPTTTATTARTSTSPGSAMVGPGRRGTRRRRAAAGRAATRRTTRSRRTPCPQASTVGHLGRGDRHPADDAAPARPARRLPVGRARDHAGPDVACRGARRDGRPGEGLRPDQLERRPVRDRHADRRHEGARVAARRPTTPRTRRSRRRCSNSPTTATRRRRRSSRRSRTPRPGTMPSHGEIQSGLVAREGAAEAGAHARVAVALRELSGGRGDPPPRSSVLDRDERADRRVGPHLRRLGERQLDAAEALRRAERRAGERVQRLAAVEVADPLDARVVVVRPVRVACRCMRPTGMCSNTGQVPSCVGAAGTPVLPGEVRTTWPLCQRVRSCGTFRCTYT